MTTLDRISHQSRETLDMGGDRLGRDDGGNCGFSGKRGHADDYRQRQGHHPSLHNCKGDRPFDSAVDELSLAWTRLVNREREVLRPTGDRFPYVGDRSGGNDGENGRKLAGESDVAMDWTASLDSLPVIAESSTHYTLHSLFQATTVQSPPNTHPVAGQAEEIIRRLIDRTELAPTEKLSAVKSNLHLSLDRSVYGISGVGLAIRDGSVSVVLMGVADPGNAGLVAAGQMLVRELQKHFPNDSIRILSKADEEEDLQGPSGARKGRSPENRLLRNEFTRGTNP